MADLVNSNNTATLQINILTDGSATGDIMISVVKEKETPCFLAIRDSSMGGGGGMYAKTHKALVGLSQLIDGTDEKRRGKENNGTQMGKAMMVMEDDDEFGRILIVEGVADKWIVKTYNIFSDQGSSIELRKSDLSPELSKGFAILLSSMQAEQGLAQEKYNKIMESSYLKSEAKDDPEASSIWDRFLSFKKEIEQITSAREK